LHKHLFVQSTHGIDSDLVLSQLKLLKIPSCLI